MAQVATLTPRAVTCHMSHATPHKLPRHFPLIPNFSREPIPSALTYEASYHFLFLHMSTESVATYARNLSAFLVTTVLFPATFSLRFPVTYTSYLRPRRWRTPIHPFCFHGSLLHQPHPNPQDFPNLEEGSALHNSLPFVTRPFPRTSHSCTKRYNTHTLNPQHDFQRPWSVR